MVEGVCFFYGVFVIFGFFAGGGVLADGVRGGDWPCAKPFSVGYT